MANSEMLKFLDLAKRDILMIREGGTPPKDDIDRLYAFALSNRNSEDDTLAGLFPFVVAIDEVNRGAGPDTTDGLVNWLNELVAGSMTE